MVFDTANNIGRFYGVLERPKFKICENQQQITPQAIRLSPEVQSELAQIARSREVAKMAVNQGLERFFDLSVTGNRVRLYVGDADTASVALRDDERQWHRSCSISTRRPMGMSSPQESRR